MMEEDCYDLVRATTGARNPNLQVVITHASHVCCQYSFRLRTTKKRNLITRISTFYPS